MAISKIKRLTVYSKYNGHCAYCGEKIDFNKMSVDHIKPKSQGGEGNIKNLNPSCIACNCMKGKLDLQAYKDKLQNHITHLMKFMKFQIAIKYGQVQIVDKKISFYFEGLQKNEQL